MILHFWDFLYILRSRSRRKRRHMHVVSQSLIDFQEVWIDVCLCIVMMIDDPMLLTWNPTCLRGPYVSLSAKHIWRTYLGSLRATRETSFHSIHTYVLKIQCDIIDVKYENANDRYSRKYILKPNEKTLNPPIVRIVLLTRVSVHNVPLLLNTLSFPLRLFLKTNLLRGGSSSSSHLSRSLWLPHRPPPRRLF